MKTHLTQQRKTTARRLRRVTWSMLSLASAAGGVAGMGVTLLCAEADSPAAAAMAATSAQRLDRDAQVIATALAHPREVQPWTEVLTTAGGGAWGGVNKRVRPNAGSTRSDGDVFADPADPYAASADPAAPADPNAATAPTGAVVAEGVPAGGKVNIAVNRTQVLTTATKYKQVSVGQPEVAEVTPLGPTSVLLTAKRPGATQLIIWDENDRSQVIDVIVGADLEALREHIARNFPGVQVTVDSVGSAVALRGTVASLQTAEQIVASAAPYSERVLNFLEVSGGQQVMLQVRFLEMSRRASQELGINLGATLTNIDNTVSFSGPNAGNKLVNPILSTLTGSATWDSFTLDYTLSALKQNNLARVLAEPNVTVISGQEASLLAGGEFPVPVPQTGSGGGSTITIEYREFGVRLNVTPVVLGSGKIRLKVAPEVSDLDFSSPVVIENNSIPIINKRRVQSTVEMGDGQTFAIAGLMRSNVVATKNATPVLGEIPVLGALFRSVRYQREETELVVLVTPRLVEPMNPGEVPQIPGVKWRHPNPAEFYLLGDLGGPAVRAPVDAVPPRFRGSYGFAPSGEDRPQTASVER